MRPIYPNNLKNRLLGLAKAPIINDCKLIRIALIRINLRSLRSSIPGSFRGSRKVNFSSCLGIYLICLASPLFCEESQSPDIAKLSEAMGHLIGKNLHSTGVPIDIDALVRGMKDGCKGDNSPLTEDECLQAIAALQEKTVSIESEKNLAEANEFLQRNQKQKGIISLENGKLQYQVVKPGSGNAVQRYNSPLMRYKGRYLNGQVFGSSSSEEVVTLDETIDGFSKGIIGMREGERRLVYVHPDLGYGRHGLSMPNALLVFEVELIKADASAEAQAASNAEDSVNEAATSLR